MATDKTIHNIKTVHKTIITCLPKQIEQRTFLHKYLGTEIWHVSCTLMQKHALQMVVFLTWWTAWPNTDVFISIIKFQSIQWNSFLQVRFFIFLYEVRVWSFTDWVSWQLNVFKSTIVYKNVWHFFHSVSSNLAQICWFWFENWVIYEYLPFKWNMAHRLQSVMRSRKSVSSWIMTGEMESDKK